MIWNRVILSLWQLLERYDEFIPRIYIVCVGNLYLFVKWSDPMVPRDPLYKSRCSTYFSQSPKSILQVSHSLSLLTSLDQKVIKTLCHPSNVIALRFYLNSDSRSLGSLFLRLVCKLGLAQKRQSKLVVHRTL